MGAYREQTRRGEGRSEEGAAARPAVAAGNEAESSGRDVVGRANKRFVFLFLEKKEDRWPGRYPTIGRWADFDSSTAGKDGPAHA